MKKQLVQFNFPGMTEKQYDQIIDELRKTGHSDIPGRIHHVSTIQNNGCQVIGVWESRELFEDFNGKILQPILNKLGIRQVQPNITPVYYEYSGVNVKVNQ